MDKSTLKKLRESMPKGWVKEVKRRTRSRKRHKGYTERMIYLVLAGESENSKIIDICIDLAIEEKTRKQELINSVIDAVK